MEQLELWNRTVFLAINGPEGSAPWLADVAIAIGEGFIYLIPLLLVWLWLWGDEERRGVALRIFLVAMLAVGLNQIIPMFWQHPRPFVIGLGYAWISHVPDSSFPSDHGTVFSATAITLFMSGEGMLALWILVGGLLVAWARIYLGVHFPLDMIGAFGVAGVAAIVMAPLWRLAGATLTHWMVDRYRWLLRKPIAAGWIRR